MIETMIEMSLLFFKNYVNYVVNSYNLIFSETISHKSENSAAFRMSI